MKTVRSEKPHKCLARMLTWQLPKEQGRNVQWEPQVQGGVAGDTR